MRTIVKKRGTVLWGTVVLGSALLGGLSGCGGGGSSSSIAPVVESSITTDRSGVPGTGANTYRTGETIQITVTFRNISGVTQTITSPTTSFLRVAVAPEDDDDPLAYVTKSSQQTPTTLTLAPGQIYSETGTYNQTRNVGSNLGQTVPRGRYLLKSELLSNPRRKIRDLETVLTLTSS